MNPRIPVLIIGAVIASGCEPLAAERPPSQDAGPIYGCYAAPDAPSFTISAAGVKFAKSDELVPFRYELPKVGTVLRIPMDASITGERFVFKPSQDRFYRVPHTGSGPVIRIAFGYEGIIRDYRRQPDANCRD